MKRRYLEPVKIGSLLVILFMLEAVVGNGHLPGLEVGFTLHMVLTFAGLITLALAGELIPLRCYCPSCKEIWRRSAKVRYCVGGLVAWGGISCLFQDAFLEGNIAFWLLWALTYFVAFRSVPHLLWGLGIKERVLLLVALLGVVVLGSVFVPWQVQGRRGGIFSPTWLGLFTATTVVFCAISIVTFWRLFPLWIPLFAVAGTLLILTRTRASIASALLAGSVCLVYTARRGSSTHSIRARLILAAVPLGLVALVCLFPLTDRRQERLLAHFRLSGGLISAYETSRAMNWEAGATGFFSSGLVGHGFLSKYGNEAATRRIAGIRVPWYDWTTAADPLNSLFLINQQIGLPGAALFLALLWSLWRAGMKAPEPLQMYFLGFFVIGLVTGFLNGNWLLSFGDSYDRYSYIALAALLHCPERWSGCACERTGGRHRPSR